MSPSKGGVVSALRSAYGVDGRGGDDIGEIDRELIGVEELKVVNE